MKARLIQSMIAAVVASGLLLGCGNNPTPTQVATTTPTSSSSGTTSGAASASLPATMALSANPASGLSALGKASVVATVQDSSGKNVPDGTIVKFSIDNSTLGSISPQATTSSGQASATFTAANIAGTVTVTAQAGTVSATKAISILPAAVGSVQFVSANPTVVGVKGAGQAATSIITFSVFEVNGQPASDGTSVTFSLNGPNGGESLASTTSSTVGGSATAILQSGSVAGPVRVTASVVVGSTTIQSSSTGVSIGGGVPSMSHFTLAPSVLNLAGLAYVNLQSTISAFLADRFGNFNVLTGTSISFYSDYGAVNRSSVTDANGTTSVPFRTQAPFPIVLPGSSTAALPAVFTGMGGSGFPLSGEATIIAVTRGEECFIDVNGNGVFDPGIDTFPPSCDIGEPYIDSNHNGVHDAGEFYIDANGNGSYDGPNGVWDGNIMIWLPTHVTFTGQPAQILFSPGAFATGSGGTQTFNLCVADANGNSLMGGSTVALAVSGPGTIANGGPFTVPDTSLGPSCYGFSVTSTNVTSPYVAQGASITATVSWIVPGHGTLVINEVISGTF